MASTNGDRRTKTETGGDDEAVSYPRKLSRGPTAIRVKGTIPFERESVMRWDGWGYKDTRFRVQDGTVKLSGGRYDYIDECPFMSEYVKQRLDLDILENDGDNSTPFPAESELPASRITREQERALRRLGVRVSRRGSDRLVRSHGQGQYDLLRATRLRMERIPDLVAWPTCHEEVVETVRVCDELGVVVVPFGGGTCVTGAVVCPAGETRPVLSLDTTAMNEILWVDRRNSLACCEAGIVGQDLERELRKIGHTCGHEPDSIEFSTLGGWVATRASGMKKNAYGNIEDIVVHARTVTPRGVLEKGCRAPRVSCGPDFDHVVLGSEGCLGVVTEVTIKIRPLPAVSRYGSLLFPDFESGVEFMRDVAVRRRAPASLRLMDNEQFAFGRAFRRAASGFGAALEYASELYITKIRGFDPSKMTLATAMYEGEEDAVAAHVREINALAAVRGGVPGGESAGKRGYNMTFAIAYTRDFAWNRFITGETMETSVPWDGVPKVVEGIKRKIAEECRKLNIPRQVSMFRIAQVYETGACIYMYFAFNSKHCRDPERDLQQVEDSAREEIVRLGGAVSHHHGIGKLRRRWYESAVSPVGRSLFEACRRHLDPNSIFAALNIAEETP